MPKKRTYNFKQLQGSSSSSSSQAATKNGGSDTSPSVNERLGELRKLEGKDAAAKKRQLADSVNQRSVPSEIREILGVPESAPPKPKAGVRLRERLRTPGPAPPKSWTANGSSLWMSTLALRGGRRRLRKKSADVNDRNRPKQLLRFARLAGLKVDEVDQKPPSLTHLALKTVAEQWDLLDEEDYPALAEIPLQLRLRILSYLAYYGRPIYYSGLAAVLQGSEDIQQLDLAGLVGHGDLTLRNIGRINGMEQETASDDNKEIAESWDADEASQSTLPPSLRTNRFAHLTHLCLSHPKPTASWRSLLAFSKFTPQLTHLSLAYWPRPTLTPNLATATVSSQHGPDVSAGGSHCYSAIDKDMSEPASLLRQLSGNLLCLQWLDLEGCAEWVPALGGSLYDSGLLVLRGWDGRLHQEPTSILTSNWKKLTYLRCAQGWEPRACGMRALRDSGQRNTSVALGMFRHFENAVEIEADVSQDIVDIEKKRAMIWLDCESELLRSCWDINELRKHHGCKPVIVDFGWRQASK